MNRTLGIVIVALVVLGAALYINAQRRDVNQWQDGTYTGKSDPDDRGYYGEIELVIKDKKITQARYRELDQEGRLKDENYPYQLGPQSHATYEERLVKEQDPEKVDVVSGATETHGRFVEAAKDALTKAERGETGFLSEAPTPKPPVAEREEQDKVEWKDGTYTAKTEPDQYGYYGEIELIVAEGKISEVNYDEKDEDGNPKGDDYPYPLGPESEDEYEKQLLDTQDPEKVEVITGATETWERFKETAKAALEKAQ